KLEARSFAILETDELAFVDIAFEGASKTGIDGRLCTEDYTLSQPWSKAFHDHTARPDGILFRARHDLSMLCAALFERALVKVRTVDTIDLSTRRGQLFIAPILDHYEFGLSVTSSGRKMGR